MPRPSTIRRLLLCLFVAALATSWMPAAAAPTGSADRIYLLGADTGYLYWSVDPSDPELGAPTIFRRCGEYPGWGIPGRSTPCTNAVTPNGNSVFRLSFIQGSILDENVTWSSDSPLRFHVEGTIDAAGLPFTVHLYAYAGGRYIESPAATEVAPGVWEGALGTGSPLEHAKPNQLGIMVTSLARRVTIELRGAGRSYVTLPDPVRARGVPQLLREDDYSPEPSSYASPTRSFVFNDTQWTVDEFEGQTGPRRTFDFDIDRKAEALVAWVEVFDPTFVQDVRRGRDPNIAKLNQGVALTLLRDGEELAHSTVQAPGDAMGIESLAETDVSAGPLVLAVDSADEDDYTLPFKAYVVAVHDERTLHSMRWRFFQGQSRRVPVAASCPAPLEQLPMTDEALSMWLDLDAESDAIGIPSWTLSFNVPGVGSQCGDYGLGDRLRFTYGNEPGIWWVGGTPAFDSLHVSYRDTVHQMQVVYTYTPASP